jgi:hypothetical protein
MGEKIRRASPDSIDRGDTTAAADEMIPHSGRGHAFRQLDCAIPDTRGETDVQSN